jgi:hypothetical protein
VNVTKRSFVISPTKYLLLLLIVSLGQGAGRKRKMTFAGLVSSKPKMKKENRPHLLFSSLPTILSPLSLPLSLSLPLPSEILLLRWNSIGLSSPKVVEQKVPLNLKRKKRRKQQQSDSLPLFLPTAISSELLLIATC